MKRFYICDVIGDGLTPETSFRPAVSDVLGPGDNQISHIESNPDGTPKFPWCISVVASLDHSKFLGRPGIDDMPDAGLDVQIGSLGSQRRNAMADMFAGRGIPANTGPSVSMREMLDGVGKALNPNFDINKFDVSDV